MRKIFLPLLFFVLGEFLIGMPANSEPTPSVRWLMNEPASLFDLGMIRLRMANDTKWAPELMEKIKKLKLTQEILLKASGVVYDFENNIINISVTLIGKPSESLCTDILKEYKELIAPFLKSYREWETLWKKDDLLRTARETTELFLGIYFNHVNYENRNKPKDLDKNIVQIMEFMIGIEEPDSAEWSGEKIFCKSKLFDNTPTFTKFQRRKNPFGQKILK